jgi:glycosyltransferase involved in cell wall biosynthesis
MKILVLIWEFPPRIVGGIARHGAELYPELVKLGHEIHLVTVQTGNLLVEEVVEGIYVHRVVVPDFYSDLQSIARMNRSTIEYSKNLLESGSFDLIHAHDWMVTEAAIALHQSYRLPIVATIHATEFGRHNGIHNAHSNHIHEQEQRLVAAAERTIVCSKYMRQEVSEIIGCPIDNLTTIYNGIRPEKKQRPPSFNAAEFRRQYAAADEKIVYYVGRMTYEKGISTLLNSAPRIIWEMGGKVKFVLIGKGGNLEEFKQQAGALGIWHNCYFTGFMSDRDLDLFQTLADCAVFPSLYEPFGIVALESFAARVPVVVSDAGGLAEIVRHEQTGIIVTRGDSNSLAGGIVQVLKNPNLAKRMVKKAYAELERRFNWADLAAQTASVYDDAIDRNPLPLSTR